LARSASAPSAAVGVPAHITVLYPFRIPDMFDDGLWKHLRGVFSALSPIDFQLAVLRRFEGEALYLASDPDEPFRQLTMAVWRLFPENPP
jgi:hypothetical protein